MLLVLDLTLLARATTAEPASPPTANEISRASAARLHLLRGEFEEASRLTREALEQRADPERAAVVLADALTALRREAEAESILRELAPSRPPAAALGRGRLALQARRFQEAEIEFQAALDLIERGSGEEAMLVALEQRADLLRDTGRAEEGAVVFEENLKRAQRLGDEPSAAWARYGLGYTNLHQGRNQEARTLLDRALESARRLDLPLWIGDIETLLAALSAFDGDLTGADHHHQEAYTAYGRAGNRIRQARCLRSLSATHLTRGEFPAALRKLREAHAITVQAGDRRESSICLEHLGSLRAALGDEKRALEQWRDAIAAGGDLWPPEWLADTHGHIGSVLAGQGRETEARASFNAALQALGSARSQRGRSELLTEIARSYRRTGDAEQAFAYLAPAVRSAREWQVPYAEAIARLEEGSCRLGTGDLSRAESSFREAERIARDKDYYNIDLAARAGRARVARARGFDREALRLLDEALTIAEDARGRSRVMAEVQRQVFLRSAYLYEDAIDLLWTMLQKRAATRRELISRAFTVAERRKARSLLDLLAESRVDLRFQADPAYQRQEQEILRRIARLEATAATEAPAATRTAGATSAEERRREVEILEDELALLEGRMRDADPRYAEISGADPPTLAAVQEALLPERGLFLEYSLGEAASYVFVIGAAASAAGASGSSHCEMYQLPGREEIESQVRALLPLLRDYNVLGADPAYYVAPAERLSQTLLGPLAHLLPGVNVLLVSPDGILHYLPFEALLSPCLPARSGPTFGDLPFLVHSLDIEYAPSASVLAQLQRRAPARPEGLLVIGDPEVEPDGDARIFLEAVWGNAAPPVPRGQAELHAVAAGFARTTQVLVGRDATVAALRRSNQEHRFVHIVAHGIFNEARPRFSGLVLMPDPGVDDDGFLTLGEVFGLELPCEQVVLSACSSALGERVTGEGIVGLTRAFLHAGAQSVVAALWDVSGEHTVRLMEGFYRELGASPGQRRGHALAEAKRAQLRRRVDAVDHEAVDPSHPALWASFVMIGDARSNAGGRPEGR